MHGIFYIPTIRYCFLPVSVSTKASLWISPKYIQGLLKVDWSFRAIFGGWLILLLSGTSTNQLWKHIFFKVSKGGQHIPDMHFNANFMFCINFNCCPSADKKQNRNILFSHNRSSYSRNAIQILLQSNSGVFHFWASLHLHVIDTQRCVLYLSISSYQYMKDTS